MTKVEYPMEYKFTFLGKGGVGKSAIMIQLINHHFVDEFDPTNSYRKQIRVDDLIAIMDMLDTASDDMYHGPYVSKEDAFGFRDDYITTSLGFVGVYDVTSRDSVHYLVKQLEHIYSRRKPYKVPLVIVANKCDATPESRQVSTLEGKSLAKLYNAEYLESSAKLRTNMDEILYCMTREIRKSLGNPFWWKPICKHLFIGEKKALSFEIAKSLSCLSFLPNDFDYPINYPIGKYFKTKECKHCISGLNDLSQHEKLDYYYTRLNADIVYLCFSLVNRTSFQKLQQYTKLWEDQVRPIKRILIGTQLDVRDWFWSQKAEKATQVKVVVNTNSDVSYFSLLPDEIVLTILRFLPVLESISCTCKRLEKLSKHESLWGIRKIDGPFITYDEGLKMAEELQCVEYLEIGANSGQGIEKDMLDKLYLKYIKEEHGKQKESILAASEKKKKKKKRFFFF